MQFLHSQNDIYNFLFDSIENDNYNISLLYNYFKKVHEITKYIYFIIFNIIYSSNNFKTFKFVSNIPFRGFE